MHAKEIMERFEKTRARGSVRAQFNKRCKETIRAQISTVIF